MSLPSWRFVAWSWMAPWTARISDSRARFFPTISDRNGSRLSPRTSVPSKSKKAIPGWPEDRAPGEGRPLEMGRCGKGDAGGQNGGLG